MIRSTRAEADPSRTREEEKDNAGKETCISCHRAYRRNPKGPEEAMPTVQRIPDRHNAHPMGCTVSDRRMQAAEELIRMSLDVPENPEDLYRILERTHEAIRDPKMGEERP